MLILEFNPYTSDRKGRGSYILFDPTTDDVLFYLRVNRRKSRKDVEAMMLDIGHVITLYDSEQMRIIVDED